MRVATYPQCHSKANLITQHSLDRYFWYPWQDSNLHLPSSYTLRFRRPRWYRGIILVLSFGFEPVQPTKWAKLTMPHYGLESIILFSTTQRMDSNHHLSMQGIEPHQRRYHYWVGCAPATLCMWKQNFQWYCYHFQQRNLRTHSSASFFCFSVPSSNFF